MYLYILKSFKDGGLYVGISGDIERRLKQHNEGKTNSTRNRTPFGLVYKEECVDLKSAREREKYFKSYKGVSEKRRIVDSYNSGIVQW